MTVRDFTLLAEMLNGKVALKMNKHTHKYLYSISGTIDMKMLKDSDLKMNYHGQQIEHDEAIQDKTVTLFANYIPRIGESLTLQLE